MSSRKPANSWKAFVTVKNTFLDVVFAGDDDGIHGKCRLRSHRSEPDLSKVNISTTFTMSKDFSGIGDADLAVSNQASMTEPMEGSLYWPSETKEDPTRAMGCSISKDVPEQQASFNGEHDEESCGDDFESLERRAVAPQNKKAQRPCKGKRQRFRKYVDGAIRRIADDPRGFNFDDLDLPPSLQESCALKNKLRAKLEVARTRMIHEHEIAQVLQPLASLSVIYQDAFTVQCQQLAIE